MTAIKKANNSEILKQVIYEMLNLAYLIEILGKNRCYKGQSRVESNDVIHTAVAVKFRLLYDFLYSRKSKADGELEEAYSAHDDFKTTIGKPAFMGLDPAGMFTSESVNKYLVCFTEERITKPKELPQPKFKGGNENYIMNSSLLLASAEKFIDSLVKGSYTNLNQENCLKDFKESIVRLMELPQFKLGYI
ncbi:MAG TPA: hypothetical protein DET40_15920 [Lentisphaeria bacterium]|nr:MAG: hypothetical protein A2X45_10555 [Lentisphaerae bacterium GWF2_50_93]HCE45028.1 hypothetical protein [Lentisphaeria bacterium]